MLSRRRFVQSLSSLPIAARLPALTAQGQTSHEVAHGIVTWLETHRRAEGGYGWSSAHQAHITPTYAAVGSYHLLGLSVPNADLVAAFVRTHYPLPEERRTVRAMRYFDLQQIQTLLWLNQSVDSFRPMLTGWTKPSTYESYYEKDALPVLQHQALALRARALVGVQPDTPEQPWLDYFQQRRRLNGTYNNTLAADGSDGHLVNTHWANWALEAMHQPTELSPQTIDWIRRCQLPSGGFTYAPSPEIAGLDNLVYTWAALHLLTGAKQSIPQRETCLHWILSLLTKDWGFQDRPDSLPNPMATFYALDCLRLLDRPIDGPRHSAPTIVRSALPSDLRVFSAQIEAPGSGSPDEAVYLAERLGIDLWCAKNGPDGWLQHTQKLARNRNLPTLFAFGNEEYGTFVNIPGLGRYSHLDDMIAPPDNTLGPFPPVKNEVYPWPKFRDGRLQQIRSAQGRMVWQFNENEELSRVLLDEAIQKGTYAAISSFHFGRGNFLEYDPFLMTYSGRIPMVGLQDAHGDEPWWWGDSLNSFRTLFLAHELSWPAFLEALAKNRILSVRHDRYTHDETEFGGCLPEVKEFAMARQEQWSWWDKAGERRKLPLGALTVLRPGMPFEKDLPTSGVALRLRLSYAPENPSRIMQTDPVSELVSLQVDGQTVQPELIAKEHDTSYRYVPERTAKTATATLRSLSTQQQETLAVTL
jgi:prenyltransferase beta subunit